jgi:Tfp pilus assembly protein PilF
MRFALRAALMCLVVSGCAGAPGLPPATGLLDDALFAPASEPIDPQAALAPSEAMRAYVRAKLPGPDPTRDRREALLDALYRRSGLRLTYDASRTRTASQAFDARAGNCLSLVLLTAAMAQEMGLSVRYQAVVGAEQWDRAGALFVAIGHVNLALDEPATQLGTLHWAARALVVDFLPSEQARFLDTRVISRDTVVAMYLNNRAVEALTQGRLDDAYWWVRESLRVDANFTNAYITLGVVYHRKHRADLADAVLQRVLSREPDNTLVLTNRMLVLRDLGRAAAAQQLAERLAVLDPNPPFSLYDAGWSELRAGQYAQARHLFERELQRDPTRHEFEYATALACLALNDTRGAAAHLARARDLSGTGTEHDLYAAKLDHLKAWVVQ